MRHTPRILILSLCCLPGLALTACGGGDENNGGTNTPPSTVQVTCGQGTVKENNKCVPIDALARCGDGTVLMDGKCVPESSATLSCGEGTTEQDGQCVPTSGGASCGEGTTLDEATGRCISDVRCGAATTLSEGECVADDELAARAADQQEGDAENDPIFGGQPEAIALPPVGDSVAALGTLDAPTDRDQDGTPDQDRDTWRVEATAGDVLELRLTELGAGALAFEVRGPNGYHRLSPRYQNEPERALFLPYDGAYDVTVLPQAVLFDPEAGPIGEADARYTLSISNLGGLMSDQGTPFSLETTTPVPGRLMALEPNLYKFEYAAPALWRVQLSGLDAGAMPQMMVLDSSGALVRAIAPGETEAILTGNVDNDRWLFVDHVSLNNARDDYQLRATKLDALTLPDTLRGGEELTRAESIVVEPLASTYVSVEIELADAQQNPIDQGLVVSLGADLLNAGLPTRFEIFDPESALTADIPGAPLRFLAQRSGRYLIKITNEDRDTSQTITELSLRAFIPAALGEVAGQGDMASASVSLEAGKAGFFIFEATAPLIAELGLDNGSGLEMELSALNEELQPLTTTQGDAALSLPPLIIPEPGVRIGQVINLGASSTQVTVTLDVTATPTFEAEPNDRPQDAEALAADTPLAGVLDAGDVDIFTIEVTDTQLLDLSALVLTGQGLLDISLSTDTGEQVEGTAPTLGEAHLVAVLSPGSPYYLTVRGDGASDLAYSLRASLRGGSDLEAEPNAASSEATALVADNARSISVGTITGIADEDWFAIDVAQDTFAAVTLEAVENADAPSQTLRVDAFEADGATPIDDASLQLFKAGTSYIRVRSVSNLGSGNTYRLAFTPQMDQNLGTLALGDELTQGGMFDASGRVTLSVTLGAPVPMNGSSQLVIWSSAAVDVFDPTGAPLHVSRDAGQIFGSDVEPSFAGVGLSAGDYQIVLRDGAPGTPWSIYAGHVAVTNEAPNNDTPMTAEALGVITAPGVATRFGALDAMDTADIYSFELTQPARVLIGQYQLGEAVADLNVSLVNSGFLPVADATNAPQVIDEMLMPGTYYVIATFVDDVGMNSGDYMLRIEAQ